MKFRVLRLFFLLSLGCIPAGLHAHEVWYVAANTPAPFASQDGETWETAFASLQDALGVAAPGDEIHIAQGVYYPDVRGGIDSSKKKDAFHLQSDLHLLGGFAGDGSLTPETRDPTLYPTIISGDIGQDDRNEDGNSIAETHEQIRGSNSYHLVVADSVTGVHLSGLVFTGGAGAFDFHGSLRILGSEVKITNCRFMGNTSPNGAALYADASFIDLEECAFTGGHARSNGGAIMATNSSELRIVNCRFENNFALDPGGAIFSENSAAEIVNCEFKENQTSRGAAALESIASDCAIEASRFESNVVLSGTQGGAIRARSTSVITVNNSVFVGNTARLWGGALAFLDNSHGTLTNCSLSGNSGGLRYDHPAQNPRGGAIDFNSAGTLILSNTIIWGNHAGGSGDSPEASLVSLQTTPIYTACLLENIDLTGIGTGNLDGTDPANDPRFADAANANLRLETGSPALDVGDATVIPADTFDLDDDGDLAEATPHDLLGADRVFGAGLDLGAYERPAVPVPSGTGDDFYFSHSLNPQVADLTTYFIGISESFSFLMDMEEVADLMLENETIAITPSRVGTAIVTVIAHAPFGYTASTTFHIEVTLSPVLFVDAARAGETVQDGVSWETAFANLPPAFDAHVVPEQEIWVREGLYHPFNGPPDHPDARHASFFIHRPMRIYGGFDGYESERSQRDPDQHVTVLSGDIDGDDQTDANGVTAHFSDIQGENSYHVVTFAAPGRLDGFTVTGGDAVAHPGEDDGGGIIIWPFVDTPELANLIVRGNRAHQGGGIRQQASVNLDHVRVIGNEATGQGGGYSILQGFTRGHDLELRENKAGWNGGGLSHEGPEPIVLVNLICRDNESGHDGGGIFSNGALEIANLLVTGNIANMAGGGLFTRGGGSLVHATIVDNIAGSQGGGIHRDSSNPFSLANSLIFYNLASGSISLPFSSLSYTTDFTDYLAVFAQNLDLTTYHASNLDGTDDSLYPGLKPDYTLFLTSPLLNRGVHTALPSDSFDLNGNSDTSEPLPFDLAGEGRFNGSAPDIGAYERLFNLLEAYRLTYGLALDGSEDDADLSGDGLGAILKLVFNLGDPAIPNYRPLSLADPAAGGVPILTWDESGLQFHFIQPNPGETGLTIQTEASSNLKANSWETASSVSGLILQESVAPIQGTGYQLVSITLDPAVADRYFLRLIVQGISEVP